jgi:hypothetical protein
MLLPELLELIAKLGGLSPYALLLLALIAYQRGWVVSAATVESIVAQTTERILQSCQRDNEKTVAEISARIIAAVDEMLTTHEHRVLREFDRKPDTGPLRRQHL